MAETSTIFGFMKYVSATDILSDFKKTVDSYFVNSLTIVCFTIAFTNSLNNPPHFFFIIFSSLSSTQKEFLVHATETLLYSNAYP